LSDFFDSVNEWYRQPQDPEVDLTQRRLAAWFDTPNARVVATRVSLESGIPSENILLAARDRTLREPAMSLEATEAYGRKLLEKVARDLRRR
jgi:hypothetical protein